MKIVKLLNCYIVKKRNNNLTIEPYSNRLGFTLVELLIVIAILGILAAAVLTSINVVSNISKANLVRAKTFSSSVENALAIAQVGKWSFEEGIDATANDTSGYTNDGTLNGGVTWQTASQCDLGLGRCLSFDGASGYVDAGNGTPLSVTEQITVEAWVYTSVVTATPRQIVGKIGGGLNFGWQLISHSDFGGSYIFRVGNGSARADSYTNYATGWHHLVGTYDSISGNTKIYLDGALKNTVILTDEVTVGGQIVYSGSSLLRIGVRSDELNWFWNGLIDEVKIYNQALLSSQIQQLYAQGLPKHQLAKN